MAFDAPLDSVEVDVRLSLETFASDLSLMKREARNAGREAGAALGGGFKGNIDSLLGPLRAFKGTILTTAAALGVGTAVAFGKQALDAADALNSLTQSLDVGIERYQEFRFAAQLAGVSEEKFRTGFSRFTQVVADAKGGNDQYIETFNRLGIALVDGNGNLRDTSDLFEEFFHKLESVETQAERTALVVDTFGRGTEGLANLGKDGGAALDELTEKAREMGLVLSEETVKSLADAKTQIDITSAVIDQNLTVVMAELGPVIVAVTSNIVDMIAEWKEFIGMFSGGGEGEEALKGMRNQLAQVEADIAHRMRDRGKWTAPADTEAKIAELERRRDALMEDIRKMEGATGGDVSVPRPRPASAEEARKRNTDLSKKGKDDAAKKAAQEAEERIRLEREIAADLIRSTEDKIAIASYEYSEKVRQINAAGYADKERLRLLAQAEEEFANKVRSYDEERAARAEALAKRQESAAKKVKDEADRSAKEQLEKLRGFTDQVANQMVEGGERGFKGLAKSFRDQFVKKAISDVLSSGLLTLGKKIGGGLGEGASGAAAQGAGKSQLLGAVLTGAKFFAGFFAGGGTIPPGQVGVVGEDGPEIVSGGRGGAKIIPLRGRGESGDGGIILQVYAVGTPESVRVQSAGTGQDGRPIQRVIVGMIADDIARGGQTAQAIQGRFAVGQRVQQ